MAFNKSSLAPVTKSEPSFNYSSSTPVSEESLAAFDQKAMNLSSDDAKWDAAKARVDLQFQDKDRVSDKEYKEALDTAYDSYNPEQSARERRGENSWTDFIGGAKEGIDAFNTGIGNVLDFGFDSLVGGGLDFIGAKGAAEDARNLFTGEDLAIIPDIATDVALTASGVGIPLMVAKNAVQLSPQMAQAISGKDAITDEELDVGQQAANAALGFGGLGLSLIPGVGKAVNIGKATSNAAAKEGIKAAEKKAAEAAAKASDNATKFDFEKALQEFIGPHPSNPELQKMSQYISSIPEQASVKTAKAFNDMSRAGRVGRAIGEDLKGLGRGFSGIPGVIGETRQAGKGLKDARKIAKEANKEADKGKYAETFRNKISELAKESGMDADEYAKTLGIDSLDNLPVRTPGMISRKQARAEAKEMAEEIVKDNPDLKIKDVREKLFDDALQNVNNQKKLLPSGFKSRSPIQSLRRYTGAAKDNLLKEANAGAPGMVDMRAYLQQLGIEDIPKYADVAGAKGAALRGGQAAGSVLGRAGSSAAGWGAGVGLVPLAEMAQNGGSYTDAINSIAAQIESGQISPFAIAPMLLTGSKGLSKRVNPGIRGTVGRSSVPHNAMRSIASAERWGNMGQQSDSEGLIKALNNLAQQASENEGEQ